MSTLLFTTWGNKYLNRVMFLPYLYIYSDHVKFYQRQFISTTEATMSYPHIVKVNIKNRIFMANIELVASSGHEDNIIINHVWKSHAKIVKKIIDYKIKQTQNEIEGEELHHTAKQVAVYEDKMKKLEKYLKEGKISNKEYNKYSKEFVAKLA